MVAYDIAPQSIAADRVLEHPHIKDRVTFLKTSEETNGEYLLLRSEVAPGGGLGLHYHPDFTEEFRAVQGRLNVEVGGRRLALAPGERALVPIGARHRWYSTSDEPIVFEVEIRPARRFEAGLRVAYGLARDGLVQPDGMPKSIWHAALLLQLAGTYPAGVPRWLLQVPLGIVAAIAKYL
jgi:quercetin dioxygenase-like cupin family protein